MKKKQLTNNLNYPLIAIVVFSFIAILYIFRQLNMRQNNLSKPSSYNPSQQTFTYNPQQPREFRSSTLKFTITVQPKFQIGDTGLTLTVSDINGRQINIIRNGTNYDNLSDYIANFDTRRNLTSSEVKKISIDGKEAMSRIVKFPEEGIRQKSYYIYVDSWVYVLSTSSESLFADLDKIAQSFRYAP